MRKKSFFARNRPEEAHSASVAILADAVVSLVDAVASVDGPDNVYNISKAGPERCDTCKLCGLNDEFCQRR